MGVNFINKYKNLVISKYEKISILNCKVWKFEFRFFNIWCCKVWSRKFWGAQIIESCLQKSGVGGVDRWVNGW